jgi:hypothetical protein
MTRKQRIEKAAAKRFAARTRRQALAAKRRIAALKGHLTRIKKYLPEALMVFKVCPWMVDIYRQRCRAALVNTNLTDREANKIINHFNTLAKVEYRWRRIQHALGEFGPSAVPMGQAKHVPKSRNSLLDWPRVGPVKEGGRIPLGEALAWHMTDAEVEHWNYHGNNYAGIPSVSSRSMAWHLNREPLTYCEALRRFALDRHWRDAEAILHETILHVMAIAGRDLRRSEHRRETDGRKLRKRKKFTARTRKVYWTWLLKCLHKTHMHQWPKERTQEIIFQTGHENAENYSDNYMPAKSRRVKKIPDNS